MNFGKLASTAGQPLKDQVLESQQFSKRAMAAFLIILAAISLPLIYLLIF